MPAAIMLLLLLLLLLLQLLVYNRSAEKAQALARRFGGMAITSLHHDTIRDAVGQWAPDVIISTIPGMYTQL
jgi:shikimate 5-dehydrogenase